MQQFGLISYAAKRAASLRSNPCLISDVNKATNTKASVRIRLEDVAEAFVILGFGCGLASLAFFIELFKNKSFNLFTAKHQ
jgi:hypothetical protein